MSLLCKTMNISRSSFYYWKKRLNDPAPRTKSLIDNIRLFLEYHVKYPSHGYRWLNAKIRLDTGLVLSDPYAHKCCKAAGIKSKAKHYKYKRPGLPGKVFPNLLTAQIKVDGPLSYRSSIESIWLDEDTYDSIGRAFDKCSAARCYSHSMSLLFYRYA